MPSPIKFNLPKEYSDCIKTTEPFFKHLFEFENALKLTIDSFLSICYNNDWWEKSLKLKNIGIYNYVDDIKKQKSFMPWIAPSNSLTLREIHFVTLGQLEVIVDNYKSECIPELFPRLDFLTGHMFVLKKIRNSFAHMNPGITKNDIDIAKNEIYTLSSQLIEKYNYYVNI